MPVTGFLLAGRRGGRSILLLDIYRRTRLHRYAGIGIEGRVIRRHITEGAETKRGPKAGTPAPSIAITGKMVAAAAMMMAISAVMSLMPLAVMPAIASVICSIMVVPIVLITLIVPAIVDPGVIASTISIASIESRGRPADNQPHQEDCQPGEKERLDFSHCAFVTC